MHKEMMADVFIDWFISLPLCLPRVRSPSLSLSPLYLHPRIAYVYTFIGVLYVLANIPCMRACMSVQQITYLEIFGNYPWQLPCVCVCPNKDGQDVGPNQPACNSKSGRLAKCFTAGALMYSVKWSQYCRASRNNQKHGKIRYKKRPGSQEKAGPVNMPGLQEFQVEGGVWMWWQWGRPCADKPFTEGLPQQRTITRGTGINQ